MSASGMNVHEAVAVLRDARGPRDIVVPSMGSAREWMAIGPLHDLDFILSHFDDVDTPARVSANGNTALGVATVV